MWKIKRVMRFIVLLIAIATASYAMVRDVMQGNTKNYQSINSVNSTKLLSKAQKQKFHCDGRKYCTEMTSCEEAEFFIRHCPNTKMDGDGDGIPCERQWCNGKVKFF